MARGTGVAGIWVGSLSGNPSVSDKVEGVDHIPSSATEVTVGVRAIHQLLLGQIEIGSSIAQIIERLDCCDRREGVASTTIGLVFHRSNNIWNLGPIDRFGSPGASVGNGSIGQALFLDGGCRIPGGGMGRWKPSKFLPLLQNNAHWKLEFKVESEELLACKM